MYKVKKPITFKIDGAFRPFEIGQTIPKDSMKEKMLNALLEDGFIEDFTEEEAVFHNEKIKPADMFKRNIPDEYKELRSLSDLKVIEKPQVIERESREEIMKIPEKVENKKNIKGSEEKKKINPIVVEETYKEEAKIEDLVNNDTSKKRSNKRRAKKRV